MQSYCSTIVTTDTLEVFSKFNIKYIKSFIHTMKQYRDGFTGGCTPPSPGQMGCRGVCAIFMIKQKNMKETL